MQLLENEQVILQSDNAALILTNFRVRYKYSIAGKLIFHSMCLNKVASIELKLKTTPALLYLAILSLGFGIASSYHFNESSYLAAGGIFAAVLTIMFFLTRTHVISIFSDGGSAIVAPASGMKTESVVAFVDKVEELSLQKIS